MKTVSLVSPVCSPETFEQLGIQLQESEKPRVVNAVLPENWTATTKALETGREITICNHKCKVRLILHETELGTQMCCRYEIALQKTGKDLYDAVLIDRRERCIIYSGGTISKKLKSATDISIGDLKDPGNPKCPMAMCMTYANTHYKHWNIPEAYWLVEEK